MKQKLICMLGTIRKITQGLLLICFLCFSISIAVSSLQWRFEFSYAGMFQCIVILALLHMLIYWLSPTRYTTKYEKKLAFLWVAVNLLFVIDKGFLNARAVLSARDTAYLSIIQYFKLYSYPWLLQTIVVWVKHKIFFQNIIGNLGIFLIIGIMLPKLIIYFQKWKIFLAFQLVLSVLLALARVALHMGVFSIDQIVLWTLSGLIGYTIFMFIQRKKTDIAKKTVEFIETIRRNMI